MPLPGVMPTLYKIDNNGFCCYSGVEEPQAVSKLLALSDKVRPHNNAKNPMPVRASAAAGSPNVMRRSTAQNSVTASPKPVRVRPPAVLLSPESSSVVGLSANKTLKKSVSSSSRLIDSLLIRPAGMVL